MSELGGRGRGRCRNKPAESRFVTFTLLSSQYFRSFEHAFLERSIQHYHTHCSHIYHSLIIFRNLKTPIWRYLMLLLRVSMLLTVDVDVICPLRTEDGCPLEPRICQLHPIPFSQVPIPFWLILTHTIFLFIYILNFLYSPYLIPFILFPIHFYSSSDPSYSELTPHSTPYLKPNPQFPNPVTDGIPSLKPGDLRIDAAI